MTKEGNSFVIIAVNIIALVIVIVGSNIPFSFQPNARDALVRQYLSALCKENPDEVYSLLPPELKTQENIIRVQQDLVDFLSQDGDPCRSHYLEALTTRIPIPYNLRFQMEEIWDFPYNFTGGFSSDHIDHVIKSGESWFIVPSFLSEDIYQVREYQLGEVIQVDTARNNEAVNTLEIVRHVSIEMDDDFLVAIESHLEPGNIISISGHLEINKHVYYPERGKPPEILSDYLITNASHTLVYPTEDMKIIWWYKVLKSDLGGRDVEDIRLKIQAQAGTIRGIPSIISLEDIYKADLDNIISLSVAAVSQQGDNIEFILSTLSSSRSFRFKCQALQLQILGTSLTPSKCFQIIGQNSVETHIVPPDSSMLIYRAIFETEVPEIEILACSKLFYNNSIDYSYISKLLWKEEITCGFKSDLKEPH